MVGESKKMNQVNNKNPTTENKPPNQHTDSKYSFVSFEFLLERKIAEVWSKASLHYHSQQVEK